MNDPQEHAAPPHRPAAPGESEPAGIAPLAPPPPIDLDYFRANEPDRRRSRAVVLWTLCLALGWVPYLCGIVNALVVAQSYSQAVVGAHRGGAALFMGLGLVSSAAALAGFVRLRHWTGAAAASVLLLAQASVAACAGVSGLLAK